MMRDYVIQVTYEVGVQGYSTLDAIARFREDGWQDMEEINLEIEEVGS